MDEFKGLKDKYEDDKYDEKWEIDHLLLSLASVSLHFYSCSGSQLVHLDVEILITNFSKTMLTNIQKVVILGFTELWYMPLWHLQ